MGSGASTSSKREGSVTNDTEIECIEEHRDKDVSSGIAVRPISNTSHRKRDTKVQPLNVNESDSKSGAELLAAAEDKVKIAENRSKEIEAQMTELEGEKLELLDEVAALEDQVESLEKCSPPTVDWTETLHAKDQYIEYLETQSKTAESQLTLLRKKFKKKLRLLNTQLSEAKQSQSIKSFEQQQEINQLHEDNNKLKVQLRKLPRNSSEPEENLSDNRTMIILDLSSRVSEQDDKITQLELKLAEKTKELDKLHDKVKADASHTSLWSSQNNLDKTLEIDPLNETKELKSVEAEIKTLQKPKKKTFRESSGISRDSGIVGLTSGKLKSDRNESDWGDSDSDMEESGGRGSLPSSAHSRVSTISQLSSYSDVEMPTSAASTLDPASIRRISAAKLRKGKKSLHGRPTPHKQQTFNTDLDLLMNDFEVMGMNKDPVHVL